MSAQRRSDAAVHDYRVRTWHQPIAAFIALTAFVIGCGMLPTVAHGAVPRYSQAYTRAAIRSEAHIADYGAIQTVALVHLAYHESRWHNWSVSSAKLAKNRCWGTFQLSYGMAHGHPWWNPYWSTMRAIRYIKHRYGTPTRALAHSHRYGWY